MLGTEDDPGIMPLTLQELFNKIDEYSSEREYKVKLWYLEIYNENIRDLLSSTDEYLDLREDPNKGVSVANISELNVTSCKDIMQILKRGNKNRTQEATNANETSSRSHAILQVQVEYKEKATGLDAEIKIGKLSLIDLAGSERASATQNRGIRLIEGANINRSLLTLGNCINALCEASEKGTKPYVPYRDSKLTRLLKDSLGGNSRTVMIANVSPSVTTFDDTYNTLKYANRAKNIKTHVQRNVLNVQYHISNYNNVINNLKNEISDLKVQLAKAQSQTGGVNNLPSKLLSDTNIGQILKKNEETKEGLAGVSGINITNATSGTRNTVNYAVFEKCIAELKSHCEEEVAIKQVIIEQEQEMNNLNAIIKNFQLQNIIPILLPVQMPTSTITYDNNIYQNQTLPDVPLNTEECIDIPIDGGEIIIENNLPSSNTPNSNVQINSNTNILIENNIGIEPVTPSTPSTRPRSSIIKDKENKLLFLKKNYDVNVAKFNSLSQKRETMMNNYFKLGIKDFYFEYLQSILKAHNAKIYIIENKYKEKFNAALASVKECYINELENQVRLRDEIIKKQGLLIEEESCGRIKSVEQLKNEYSLKLPIIPINPSIRESSNSSFNNVNSKNILTNLPKIAGLSSQPPTLHHHYSSNNVTNNINAIISEVKGVSSNISKIEMNNLHNQILKRDKSKLKSDFLIGGGNNHNYYHSNTGNYASNNSNSNQGAKESKISQIRNYSQGVRNANLNIVGGQNNLNIQNNLNQLNHQNSYQSTNINSAIPGGEKILNNINNIQNLSNNNLNTGYQNPYSQNRNHSKNNSAKPKSNTNSNQKNINIKKTIINKDNSHSDKSGNVSHNGNISEQEQDDSDVLDLDNQQNQNNINNINNISDEDIAMKNYRKRNNHFKDFKDPFKENRKNLYYFNSKDESPSYMSPYRKDLPIGRVPNRREDNSNNKINNWNDYQPQIKKKELNVYLNEKHGKVKLGVQKKTPFKI
jgi:hypothetical protein